MTFQNTEAFLANFVETQIKDYVTEGEIKKLRAKGYRQGEIDFSALHCAFDANEMYPPLPEGDEVPQEFFDFCNLFADRVSKRLKEMGL